MENVLLKLVRDPLPEYLDYHDTGCEVAPACLDCPLPLCKHDDPGQVRRAERRQRDGEVVRLREDGLSAREIASRLGISKRSVYRVLERAAPDRAWMLTGGRGRVSWGSERVAGPGCRDR